ncbi:MAG TPA: PPC domain-containing protein [Burkholderiales bacterium]|nr:PPC domain-containing protein [Burkholderiales bacterium]
MGTRNVADGCLGPTINEIEPNGTFAQSQVVTFPASISGSTFGAAGAPSADNDAFSFTLASARTVTITLAGGTAEDMDLFLFNASQTNIGQSTGLDSNETITMALAPGTYHVAVIPFDVTTITSYTLNIQ